MMYIHVVYSCVNLCCIYVALCKYVYLCCIYMLCIVTIVATSGARTVVMSISPMQLDVIYTQPVVRYPPLG